MHARVRVGGVLTVPAGGMVMIRKFAVEFLGTAIPGFVAVGSSTLMFGFDGGSRNRGHRDRAGSDGGPSCRHPDHRHVSESCEEPGPGPRRRRHASPPGMAVHRGARGGRSRGCRLHQLLYRGEEAALAREAQQADQTESATAP